MNDALKKIFEAFGIIAGSLIAFATLWKKVLVPGFKKLRTLAVLMKHADKFLSVLEKISSEFKNNSGSSLRDSIDRIERKVDNLDNRIRVQNDLTDYGLFETDRNGLVISVNHRWCHTVGATPEQLLGNGWINIVEDDDREEVVGKWRSAIADLRELVLDVNCRNLITNEKVKLHVRAIPVYSGENVDRFVGRVIKI